MNSFVEIARILNHISVTGSTNEKKVILSSVDPEIEIDLRNLLFITYNPHIRYYVTRVQAYLESNAFDEEYTPSQLWDDLSKLSSRQITGHDALAWVIKIYEKLPQEFRPYLEKILKKDFKIGLAIGLINDVFPDLIPEYKLGLCERWKKVKRHELKFPMIAEPKADGVRGNVHFYSDPDGIVTLSRSGMVYYNYTHIEEQILQIPQFKGYMLDGEIQSRTFNSTMSSARSKHKLLDRSEIFRIWDMIPIEEFDRQVCSEEWVDRRTRLEEILTPEIQEKFPALRLMPWEMIESYEEIEPCFDRHFEAGDEGIILKDPHSLYIYSAGTKRGKAWIKYKIQDRANSKMTEISAKVLGVYNGEKGTKNEFILGGFYSQVLDSEELGYPGEEIFFNCGGGFKQPQRETFWTQRESLIGKVFNLECQEVSRDKEGKLSIRFPVFKGFRSDLG